MHHHRPEQRVVVRGTARVTREKSNSRVTENESAFIPLGTKHRREHTGRLLVEMIEAHSGSCLGKDDIGRFEDTYGR